MRVEAAAVARGKILVQGVALFECKLRLLEHVLGFAGIGLLDDLEAHFAATVFPERNAWTGRVEPLATARAACFMPCRRSVPCAMHCEYARMSEGPS